MSEYWKPITGYKGLYAVSNYGRVKRTSKGKNGRKRGTILNPQKRGKYLAVSLTDSKGISVRYSVHRLVAQEFIRNRFNKPQVNHIDGNKYNNRSDNLEWVTSSENNKHACIMYPKKHLKGSSVARKINMKPVRCIETGLIYDCAVVAARITKIDGSSICRVCRGARSTAGGFRWEYV